MGLKGEPSYPKWRICGLEHGFCNCLQGADSSKRVVKKARVEKLGADSGACDDIWYSIG